MINKAKKKTYIEEMKGIFNKTSSGNLGFRIDD